MTQMTTRGAPVDEPCGRPIPTDPEALLFTAEAAFLAGLNPRTLDAKRVRGGGPKFIRYSARAVRYRRQDVVDWINGHSVSSTADPGNAGPEGGR